MKSEKVANFAARTAIGPFGSRMKSDVYTESGVPVIRGTNLTGGKVLAGGWVYVSEKTADDLANCCVFPGDIVFPHRGAIGEVGIVPDEFPRYVMSSSLMMLSCDRAKADPDYIYYFFKSAAGRHELLKNSSQVGTPGIGQPLSTLRAIEVPLPPLGQQREIAKNLSDLDAKIDLNHRINQTLEAMAQAIFKSWFVDFEPVKAKIAARAEGRDPLRAAMSAISSKTDFELDAMQPEQHAQLAATAALFPDEMVESELGEIPKGWKCDSFGAIASLVKGSINPLIHPDRVFEHYSLPAFDDGKLPVLEKGAQIKSNKTRFGRGVVLQSKLNPHISRVWYPLGASEDSVCSTEFLPWIAKKPASPPFLYCLLTSPRFEILVRSLVTGTSNSHQRVKPDQVAALPVLTPSREILTSFEIAVAPLFRAVECATQQGRTLAELRDTLLPKMLSGELSVTAHEIEALA